MRKGEQRRGTIERDRLNRDRGDTGGRGREREREKERGRDIAEREGRKQR